MNFSDENCRRIERDKFVGKRGFRFTQLLSWLDRGIECGVVVSSTTFILLVLVSVASRFILKMPVLFAVEISRLAFVWSIFLAAAIGFKRHSHIAISFFYEKFSANWQRRLSKLSAVFAFAMGSVLLHQSWVVAKTLWASKLPICQLSQGWFYVPVIIFATCLCLYSLLDFLGFEAEREGGKKC